MSDRAPPSGQPGPRCVWDEEWAATRLETDRSMQTWAVTSNEGSPVCRAIEEDAQLIAAAPDLYRALENALRMLAAGSGTRFEDGEEALAKARGER